MWNVSWRLTPLLLIINLTPPHPHRTDELLVWSYISNSTFTVSLHINFHILVFLHLFAWQFCVLVMELHLSLSLSHTHTHTHTQICKIYCLSTATMVARMSLSVMFHVCCLSCFSLHWAYLPTFSVTHLSPSPPLSHTHTHKYVKFILYPLQQW